MGDHRHSPKGETFAPLTPMRGPGVGRNITGPNGPLSAEWQGRHCVEVMNCPGPVAGATTWSYVSEGSVCTLGSGTAAIELKIRKNSGSGPASIRGGINATCPVPCTADRVSGMLRQEPSSKNVIGCPGNPLMLLSDASVCSRSAMEWQRRQ